MSTKTISKLPFSLERVNVCLGKFQPPSEPFAPQGTWEHRYAIWIVFPEDQPYGNTAIFGALRIIRKPISADTIELEINQQTLQGGRGISVYHVEAHLTCAADRLTTPRTWEVRTVSRDRDGNPIPGTETHETGRVEGGVIWRRLKTERSAPAPKAFTCNWCLFDVLQRLPGNETEPLTFDIFEEMDLLKRNHHLSYRHSVEMELGGRRVALHGFEHFGEGILPYTYWLDDQRRLLIAVGGLRAYIFDPNVSLPEGKR